jgi:diguanylate cyclase (GGDEF)-like protein/PAS domain S-box-containing protein
MKPKFHIFIDLDQLKFSSDNFAAIYTACDMTSPLILFAVVSSCATLVFSSLPVSYETGGLAFAYTAGASGLLGLLVSGLVSPMLSRRMKRAKHAEKAIDSVNSGYWVLNAEGAFLDVNPAYCRMVGYSRSQILSMSISDFEATATQPQIRAQIQRILQHGQEQFETRHRKSNGQWIELEITATAVDKHQVIVFLRDITDRKQAAEVINSLAFFDPLTSLPNRLLLQDRMEQALICSARTAQHGALLFINLDHFKLLNDTLGHYKGDLLLQQVGQRISASIRDGDTVARFGGDEFVVVLGGLNESAIEAATEAEVIGRKILTSITPIFQLGKLEHHSTASMGITLFCGLGLTIEDLLKKADLAMSKSKTSGRNALHFFDPAMQSTIVARMALEEDLHTALREMQFALHYQAQVTREQHIAGAEALVRWHHPKRGMVSPADFIPLAEDCGLILPLGQWVLETACRQLAQWATQPDMADLIVAVNISGRQLQQEDFVNQVVAILKQTGAKPERLKLELTESVLISNLENTITKMSALKSLGVGFSLDDFGTGYSSLAYLSRLPLDQLKIDRSFVMNIESNDNATAICAAIISLSHSLQLRVVAEGVETEAQRYFLNTVHRCDFLQGYLISRPLPVEEFETLVQQMAVLNQATHHTTKSTQGELDGPPMNFH